MIANLEKITTQDNIAKAFKAASIRMRFSDPHSALLAACAQPNFRYSPLVSHEHCARSDKAFGAVF
jgi:hypothetical protein